MNVIPKLSGPVALTAGTFRPALPLGYAGDCASTGQFPLVPSEEPVLVFETDTAIPAEGYRLTVEPEQARLAAWDENGRFYGLQTLFRLLEEGPVPCGVYEDAPHYRYRGFLLDVSRHFFSVEQVKKLIDQCAKLKLNVLHWHLSDDQGFRVESKKFPRLNEISSWRVEPDGSRYGGYYTQEEIRDIVAFAQSRFVTVVPEIDLPGHTTAIVAAYPELSCSGEPAKVENGSGVFPRILCGGSEKVLAFLEELLDEVCGLFPESGWFHIGGDEAPKAEWEKCPKCQAEMAKHGLENEEELQALFTQRLTEMLNRRGKTVIGWNEILASGKMKPGTVAQYWTDDGADYSAAEIAKGREFVFSNDNAFYFCRDYPLATLRGAYEYEPHIPGGEAIKPEQTLGLEAAMWTERVPTFQRLEELTFPRLAALAECAWTKSGKEYGDFLARLAVQEELWRKDGVAFVSAEKADVHDAQSAAQAVIRQYYDWNPAQGMDKAKERAAAMSAERLSHMLSPSYSEDELKQIETILKA